jgi:hypothetical protein
LQRTAATVSRCTVTLYGSVTVHGPLHGSTTLPLSTQVLVAHRLAAFEHSMLAALGATHILQSRHSAFDLSELTFYPLAATQGPAANMRQTARCQLHALCSQQRACASEPGMAASMCVSRKRQLLHTAGRPSATTLPTAIAYYAEHSTQTPHIGSAIPRQGRPKLCLSAHLVMPREEFQ